MREFSAPDNTSVSDEENLTDMVWANAERFADSVGFRRRVDGSWVDVTTKAFAADVLAAAKGLIAAGLRPGDRVALLSKTRYEWSLLDFAIWTAGCVTVPIYETSSAEAIEWILSDSGARAIVVETDEHHKRVESVIGSLAELERVWQIEAGPDVEPAVDELTDLGTEVSDDDAHKRRLEVRAEDTATLVYTSGTTGRPKGVVLTHRNLLAEVRADIAAFPQLMRPGNSMLVFLPMAHVFARAITLCCVYARTTLGHVPDVKNLVSDLGTFRPTFVVAVPRVFEKVYNSAKQKAHAEGKGQIFDLADRLAVAYSESLDTGGPSPWLRVQHAIAGRLVYTKLRAALGSRCVAAISGSAPLGARLAHFFRGVGVPVYEGYGLTETSAAATVNSEGAFRVGTVGRPISGTSVRIAEDGEIQIAGDVVFSGYWHNDEATSDAVDDGWLRTGDIGELDGDGFLRITGRSKEILITAGGKNVAPAPLENRLRAHPLISQCMVVGEGRPFVGALITLDPEFAATWARDAGRAGAPITELATDERLRAELRRAVDDANSLVSRAESIREFRVLPTDFTEEAGELTPSMKLRRAIVAERYAADIEAMYVPS
ncbi:long-chain acyl-CoA synthetase [Herbihabitans rhizosphaerae]|uniref:Acyl-CoA synthetase n=1 Tax=Herbihabitans rhizosphaerae TaxID=1872711 RepID=A0A4Q7KR90_9PSEU|nr:long-chain fatty acid--CoA ligase [Herbihabitans rhizosphaerae]RZS38916.1 long-chain acyl-CoA synthetase [Herbihabitans rhizosphaerae]